MSEEVPSEQVRGNSFYSDDQPLTAGVQLEYGRSRYANAIAQQVLEVPSDRGFVIGILGPWGSGKTTILNQIAAVLGETSNVVVFRFNPWLFAGTDELVAALLVEMSRELGQRPGLGSHAKRVAKAIGSYATLLAPAAAVPGVGTAIAGAAGVAVAAGKVASLSQVPSLERQREGVRTALATFGKRLVVVLDDIDRLADQEIRDVMRLVRVTADFPNTVYLLAFDRARVERVLGTEPGEGRDYLEKILQVTHDVPEIPAASLGQQFFDAARRLQDIYPGPVNEVDLLNVVYLVITPLLKTPRDVNRVANAIPVLFSLLGEEVAFADAIAVEAVQVLRPDLYVRIMKAREALTATSINSETRGRLKQQLDDLIKTAGTDSDALFQLLRRVFPAHANTLGGGGYGPDWKRTWRRDRRLAEESVLDVFAERCLRHGQVATSVVRHVVGNLGDSVALGDALRSVSDDEFEDLLDRMLDYESQFPPESAASAIEAFSNQWDRLRTGRTHSFDPGADMAMGRLTLRLLRRVQDPAERLNLLRGVLPRIDSLSARLDLVDLAGYREGIGHKLVERAAADELAAELRRQVIERPSDRLARERDLGMLLLWLNSTGTEDDSGAGRTRLHDPAVFFGFIRSLVREGFSRPVADVAESVERVLPFQVIAQLLDDATFGQLVGEAEAAIQDHEIDTALLDVRGTIALDLAVRYRDGWRPKDRWSEDFDEDEPTPELNPTDDGAARHPPP